MEPITTGIVAAAVASAVAGKPKKLKNIGKAKKGWLDKFIVDAKEICATNSVPFQVCVTQAALESGWGAKAPGFNYFGIKGAGDAGSSTFASTEYVKGQKKVLTMKFAKFSSMKAGVQGYCNVMKNNPLFKPATDNFSNDPVDFFIWIWSHGYATLPDYVARCVGVMSVIYRATGNEEFNIKYPKDKMKLVAKLREKEGSARRAAAKSAMLPNVA